MSEASASRDDTGTRDVGDADSVAGSVASSADGRQGAAAVRTPADRRLLVVDGHSLAFRAYFALPVENFSTKSGQPTNAVWGFATMLSNVIRDEKPTHIGVAFDMKGGTFRQKMLPQYKGTRDAAPEELLSQLPIIQQMLKALGITYVEKQGYEGDDIIGTLATMGEAAGCDTLVLSGDRDAFQLVDDSITVLYPGHHFKDLKHMTPAAVFEKYKVSPQQYPDLAAMRGEQADNIPGVPGVGDGYAAKWINQYGGLEQIIEHADDITGKKGQALRDNIDQVRLNRKVNALVRDLDLGVTIDDLAIGAPDRKAVDELFSRLEFSKRTENTILKPFPQGQAASPADIDLSVVGGAAEEGDSETTFVVRVPVMDEADAPGLAAWMQKHCGAALAPADAGRDGSQTDPHKPFECHADLRLHIDDSHVWAIYAQGDSTPGASRLHTLTVVAPDSHVAHVDMDGIDADSANAIAAQLAAHAGSLALHGYKEHLHMLASAGIACPEPWLDTKLAGYLESAGAKQDIDSAIARVLPTGALPDAADILPMDGAAAQGEPGQGEDGEPTLFDLDADAGSADADGAARSAELAGDVRHVIATVALAESLAATLDDRAQGGLLHDIEYPVSCILAGMEDTGAAIDPMRMQELFDTFAAASHQAEDVAWDAAGSQINLQSPKQVQGVLFDTLKLAPVGRTKSGGYKTDSDALMELALRNAGNERASAFISALLRYRGTVKLKQCVESLQKAVNPDDGLIHTTYEQEVTATGRLSSANPNLQNIPNRNEEGREIRSAFVPGDGYVALLSSDYSQVELRIMAHLSGDEALIEAFKSGRDFHKYVASLVYGVPVDDITPDQRSHVKAMSYGLAYGLSTYGLAQQLRISPAEADILKGKYFATFGKVHDYLESLVKDAKRKGYTETMFGRRRYIPDLTAKNWARRDAAERAALNAPIQGTAADIMKIAMVRTDNALRAAGVASRVVLQIHDELVVELAPGEQDEVTGLVKDAMEHAVDLSVPLDVSTGVGANWQLAAH